MGFERETELSYPLAQFQAKMATKDGTFKLLESINEFEKDRPLSPQTLQESFGVWWPLLEPRLEAAKNAAGAAPRRSTDEKVDELL